MNPEINPGATTEIQNESFETRHRAFMEKHPVSESLQGLTGDEARSFLTELVGPAYLESKAAEIRRNG